MTDLNKLRSEFEAWFTTTDVYKRISRQIQMCGSGRHQDIFTVFQRDDWREENYAQVSVMASWLAWQEKAKAQAVPETHLLIPKEPRHDTIIAIASVCLGPAGSEAEFLNLDEAKDVYQALVASESGAEG
ncbi:hypothetical protein ACT4WO_13950 [Acinetobacter baumannii]